MAPGNVRQIRIRDASARSLKPNQSRQRNDRVRNRALKRILSISCFVLVGLMATGCQKKTAAPAGAGMQGMPVQTVAVSLAPVPQSSEYVATIKSRRSATLMPQVSGLLTQILVHSGDHVKAGQTLMNIDPRQQQATVDSQRATERQKKALFDYNTVEVERQRKLFEAGVTSHDVYDQARQAFENSKADYESAVEARKTQEELLAYYTVRAPFDGVVGDIPVHVGDFASPSSSPATVLTTVDENRDLEAYIYIPTERASQVRQGLVVHLTDTNGKLLEKTSVDFVSAQVDSTLQGILVKAPVHVPLEVLRTAQLVKARVIWSTSPMAVVPVLAVTRQGGQSFVFLAKEQGGHFFARQTPVTLGDTVGNTYSVPSGLVAGDKVIVTNTQFLVEGMPVMPLGG
jgi:RND family efflux transporter MFP subunit